MPITQYATTKRQRYEIVRSSLLQERSSFETHWKELADNIRPRRIRLQTTDKNRGDRRNNKIIDSTATFAARTLQSGMHAGITSPARPWFKLTVPDADLAEYKPVKDWLHTVTERMSLTFQRSNIYNSLPVVYGDLGVFGTAAMAVVADEKDVIRCYTYPVGSYALGVSDRQVVDIFIREYQMTIRQLVEKFGRTASNEIDWSKFSAAVKNQYDLNNLEAVVGVTWIIAPNPDANERMLEAKFLPFLSCHFENGQDKEDVFLRESGFSEFPIMAPRWEVVDDIYAVDCPGMTCLGDIKALQLMTKKKAQAVEKLVNPPVQASNTSRNQKISLLPGEISYVDDTSIGKGIRSIHEINLDIRDLTADIQDTRRLIQRAFYEDLFLMLAQSEMNGVTAREIDERHEEKLLALGPVLERTSDELLDPTVDRTFAEMGRAGQIPEPPEELQGMPLTIVYTSILAQAQKMVGVSALDRFFSSTVPMIEAFPSIRHKINILAAVDDYGDMLGVNPAVIVSNEDAQAAIDAEQQAVAQQRQIEQQGIAAKSTRDLANAPTGGDTALAEMMGVGR